MSQLSDLARHSTFVHHGWQLRALTPGTDLQAALNEAAEWLEATVPGTVQQDLLRHDVIPDPYLGLNENEVQWVGETDWLYRTTFTVDEGSLAQPNVELVFGGLDTVCEVRLNGQVILKTDNMFVPERVDVKALLRPADNELLLHFSSPLRESRAREAHYGVRAAWNGNASRVYLRKAQYHYGWDWGPVILTSGPWLPIELHAYSARLGEVAAPVTLAGGQASVQLTATVVGEQAGVSVHAELRGPDGGLVAQTQGDSAALNVPDPQLWWPHGYGAQPLYTLSVQLRRGDELLDEQIQRLGLRRTELRQEPVEGEAGVSFTFAVNGTEVFTGGANWIPEDLLLNRVTPGQERARIQQAVDAGMLMLRVWAGGIYETDSFYDACDELGVLVWQDFLFGCGMYPAHPEFLASVRREAQAAVKRLRHHASLALWCGNNEDYQIAESVGAGDFSGQADLAQSAFPAREIYERLLPEICADLDPATAYWPGSPYTPGGPAAPAGATTDQTKGDRHTWDVWHGSMAPYGDYGKYEGRFVSEFGLQSAPAMSTILSFTQPADRHANSRVMEHHNKAGDGPRRLAVYLSDTVQPPADFAEWVYDTRLVQAEAMVAAYRAYRRRWGHAGKRAVSGALVWQLNDCWPVTSWALIDSHGLPKPALYAVGRELAPVAVGAERHSGELSVWICSSKLETQAVEIELDVFSLTGEPLHHHLSSEVAAPNATTELSIGIPALKDDAVVFVRAFQHGVELSRAALWPEPLKYFALPDPELSVQLMTTVQGDQLSVGARLPVKGVWIDAGAALKGNHFDLMPGERVSVTLPGGSVPVTVRAVGSAEIAVSAQPAPIQPAAQPVEAR
ncbi:hypothetical protein [Deinococcus sp.]|uniref:beta-mannosidase n=1 Tax=Deinococcus sp. TaxID=47478 RepID=UPI0025D1EF95|nr:hypothetical protein [Deinococcus sp.]